MTDTGRTHVALGGRHAEVLDQHVDTRSGGKGEESAVDVQCAIRLGCPTASALRSTHLVDGVALGWRKSNASTFEHTQSIFFSCFTSVAAYSMVHTCPKMTRAEPCPNPELVARDDERNAAENDIWSSHSWHPLLRETCKTRFPAAVPFPRLEPPVQRKPCQ